MTGITIGRVREFLLKTQVTNALSHCFNICAFSLEAFSIEFLTRFCAHSSSSSANETHDQKSQQHLAPGFDQRGVTTAVGSTVPGKDADDYEEQQD